MWALPSAIWRRLRRKKSSARTIPEGGHFKADVWSAEVKRQYHKHNPVQYAAKLDELRRQVSAYQQEIVQLNDDLVRVRRRNVELEADDIRDRIYNDINHEED